MIPYDTEISRYTSLLVLPMSNANSAETAITSHTITKQVARENSRPNFTIY